MLALLALLVFSSCLLQTNIDEIYQYATQDTIVIARICFKWDKRCILTTQAFEDCAKNTKHSNSKFVEVDASINVNSIEANYHIYQYPAIIAFYNNSHYHYEDEICVESIDNFISKSMKSIVLEIGSYNDIDMADSLLRAIIISDDNGQIAYSLAPHFSNMRFYHSRIPLDINRLTLPVGSVLLVNAQNEVIKYHGEFEERMIKLFYIENNLQTLNHYDDNIKYYINAHHNDTILLIHDRYQHSNEFTEFREASKEASGLIFADVSKDYQYYDYIVSLFKVPITIPSVAIIHYSPTTFVTTSYILNITITRESIMHFVKSYQSHELKPTLLTEETPKYTINDKIKKLVGSNFYQELKKQSHSIVLFIKSKCNLCDTAKRMIDTAQADLSKMNIGVYYINMTSNEVEDIYISKFPSLWIYDNGIRKATYNMPYETNILLKFIQQIAYKNEEHQKPHKESHIKTDL